MIFIHSYMHTYTEPRSGTNLPLRLVMGGSVLSHHYGTCSFNIICFVGETPEPLRILSSYCMYGVLRILVGFRLGWLVGLVALTCDVAIIIMSTKIQSTEYSSSCSYWIVRRRIYYTSHSVWTVDCFLFLVILYSLHTSDSTYTILNHPR